MSVRDTSILAHDETQTSGSAKSQRGRILSFIESQGIVSRTQISRDMGIPINAVCGRVNELVRDGAVIESQQLYECPVTKRRVHLVSSLAGKSLNF